MMSSYIKELEMPKDCDFCPIRLVYLTCGCDKEHCMIQDVKEPHGRLIDADALYRRIKTECNPYGNPTIGFEDGNKVLDMIDIAPTVIEAEDGE